MRFVALREFQRFCYRELKNVPFILTREIWVVGKTGAKHRDNVAAFVVRAYDPAIDGVVKPPPAAELFVKKSEKKDTSITSTWKPDAAAEERLAKVNEPKPNLIAKLFGKK